MPGRAWQREEDAALPVPRLCPEHVPYLLAGHRAVSALAGVAGLRFNLGAHRPLALKGQTMNSRGFEPTEKVVGTSAERTLKGSTNMMPGGYDWSTPSGSRKTVRWISLPTG